MQHKLYALRKEKGFSQQQMADMLDISSRSYREKELSRSAFNSDEMFIIANMFDRDIADIFLPRESPSR